MACRRLQANFEFSQFFPCLGLLGRSSPGSLGATAHFGFGYDTTGLREYFKASSSDQRQLSMLLDGLYVSDRQNADGTGNDVPEVTLTGGIDAAAELNLGIASAGVSGGIFADMSISTWTIRITTARCVWTRWSRSSSAGRCAVFDVSGELTAGLKRVHQVPLQQEDVQHCDGQTAGLQRTIVPRVPLDPDPILATLLPGGVLQLNRRHARGGAAFTAIFPMATTPIPSRPARRPIRSSVEAFGFSAGFHRRQHDRRRRRGGERHDPHQERHQHRRPA